MTNKPPRKHPDEYDVGYRKPPKDRQFKKGASGNHKGRPKDAERSMTIAEMFLKSGRKKMTAKINGVPVKKSMIEFIVDQQMAKAAKGDNDSFKTTEKHISAALEAEARKLEKENSKAAETFAVGMMKMLNEYATLRKTGLLSRDQFPTLEAYSQEYIKDEDA